MNLDAFTLPITDPVLIFGLTMMLLLLVPILFRRLRVPDVVGLILAGAVVGPHGLGWLERDQTFVLLGTVGLLYLMFLAGLEIDLNQFNRLRKRSITFGLISFFLPQSLAMVLAGWVLGYDVWQALLLGSIVGSHTLLALPIAQRLGITRNQGVTMVTGGTMVTDLLSLLILAVVEAQVSGASGMGFWLLFAGLVVVYGIVVLVIIPRGGQWFFRNVRQQANAEFIFLLAMLFTSAALASVVRLAPIIGAFLVGLSLNRLVPNQSSLMVRLSFVGQALFIPFFLISVGMLVDLRNLFSSLSLWGVALFFTALVVVGKGGAILVVGKLYNHTRDEIKTLIGLTVPQAAATLAVTLIGFDIGLFDVDAVNAVVLMILLTCLFGPLLVERFGREVALADQKTKAGDAPEIQRILVPLANPETAGELVDIALLMRHAQSDEPLFPLTVARAGENEEQSVIESEKLLTNAVLHAAAADVAIKPLTRIDYNVAQGITRAIREERISLVVIGWNGQSLARTYIFGSVMDEVLNDSRAMVAVCRSRRPFNTNTRILVAIPPLARRELGFGAMVATLKTMANQMGASLVLLTMQGESDAIRTTFASIKPDAALRFDPVKTWSEVPSKLDTVVQPNDMILLVSVREGTVAWRPSLNRLPRVLASRFGDVNFVTLYLPDPTAQHASDSAHSISKIVTVALDDFPDHTPEALIRYVVHTMFPGSGISHDRLVHRIISQTEDYAPELKPGLALYHAHSSLAEEPVLVVATSEAGLSLPGLSGKAFTVMLLVVPASMHTQVYLTLLDTLTRLGRDDEALQAFLDKRAQTL